MIAGEPAAPDLAVDERGAGPPVVLLHSGGLSSRQWKRLSVHLAPDHRVIAPDLLGYGKSPPVRDDATFTFRDDAAAVLRLLEGLSEPAHLVGHSYGGLLALRLALDHPGRVRSLSVFEPVAFSVLHAANDEAGLADLGAVDGRAFLDDARGGDARWLTGFVDFWSGDGAFAALPEEARASWLAVGRKVFLEVRSLLGDRAPRGTFAAVRADALLLSGARSRVAARRVCELLAAEMPRAVHRVVEGAGHMGPLTHGAAVNALIAAHIRAR